MEEGTANQKKEQAPCTRWPVEYVAAKEWEEQSGLRPR